ncbi:hypothetical protein LCGC14_2106280 [marine sediment metagenome]|uniref:Uncharacterized protein n=1 Tax=marine sediment metagenome TaxID=412755 RepID=A0A0F9E8N9_9ZZZZ
MISSIVFAAALGCIPYQSALDHFWEQWEEVITYSAITNNGLILETLVNKETTTWTMLLVRPDKMACLLSSGDGWRVVIPPLGDDDA